MTKWIADRRPPHFWIRTDLELGAGRNLHGVGNLSGRRAAISLALRTETEPVCGGMANRHWACTPALLAKTTRSHL
jgi:hypothetical protein